MALSAYSKFYYGFKIEETQTMISIKEGSDYLNAELTPGTYTMKTLVEELSRALNAAGGQVYIVSVDRKTRLVTIQAEDPFELLCLSGEGFFASGYPVFGFSVEADLVGSNEYTSQVGCGAEYKCQLPLQSYMPTSNNMKPIDPVKKKTITGVVEAVSFGHERFMECEMVFITNIPMPADHLIRNNFSGREDAIRFLTYASDLGEVEFIEDERDPDTYEVLILEATESETTGMGFRLIEMYDESLPNYFRTGNLTWRLREDLR